MSAPAEPGPAPVLVERRGRLGILTLNRPRALNALDTGMVGIVSDALAAWADDDAVATVLVRGAGERGLCAGGDVVGIARAAQAGDRELPARFWRDEYRMNAAIARFPKPYVALMDGIVLGGGVGISAHGSHRVVTERTRLGMPETGIGFVPDVGGTRLLAHAPGELGTHLGLTGDHVTGVDAIALGFADAFVPSDRFEALAVALETEDADVAIASVAESAPPAPLLAERAWIDAAYAGDDLSAILDRLTAGEEPARAAAATLATRSPTALAITLRSLRAAAAESTLEEALRREYRVSTRVVALPDFVEGIRAQLVDKDSAPRWRPAALADVDPAVVDAAFAPVDPELPLPPAPLR
ncbi:enoyl-CoA hydratase/isomerase family protein [Pseudolysinimonas sp.]|uniref:enoyl-CoA hydratase/isomerase family protein n=1 Tax=Pseudolysinimonas sp. TaxID=2680009 RepID=UPI003F7F70A6